MAAKGKQVPSSGDYDNSDSLTVSSNDSFNDSNESGKERQGVKQAGREHHPEAYQEETADGGR